MPELKSAYLTAQNFKTALAVKSWGSKQCTVRSSERKVYVWLRGCSYALGSMWVSPDS